MKVARVREHVDGSRVPPQAHLAVTYTRLEVSIALAHAARQRGEHLGGTGCIDEDVHVDVDRAAGTFGAPRQRERAPERMRQPGMIERGVEGGDLADDARRAVRHTAPNRGNFNRGVCRAGNCSARCRTSTSSRLRSASSAIVGVSAAVTVKPAARTIRSHVSTVGVTRPDSYAARVECDVPRAVRAPASSTPTGDALGAGSPPLPSREWYQI